MKAVKEIIDDTGGSCGTKSEDEDNAEHKYNISKEQLESRMLESGIDCFLFCRIIKEGLQANKKEEPDHTIRLKYLQLSLQILNIFPPEKKEEEKIGFESFDYSKLTDEQLEEEYRKKIELLRSINN
ncbi:MAG: hypothetical protein K8T10_16150 [Candidatus Eremiobacteraeota bacterium]|nr:hypothetical protein [Candidatus Eremiobacteraeota bacterium]